MRHCIAICPVHCAVIYIAILMFLFLSLANVTIFTNKAISETYNKFHALAEMDACNYEDDPEVEPQSTHQT